MSGPQESTKSIYRFPSASVRKAPSPRAMNRGTPPTFRNARTGEFTPPGMTFCAASNRSLFVTKILLEGIPHGSLLQLPDAPEYPVIIYAGQRRDVSDRFDDLIF